MCGAELALSGRRSAFQHWRKERQVKLGERKLLRSNNLLGSEIYDWPSASNSPPGSTICDLDANPFDGCFCSTSYSFVREAALPGR